MILTQAVDLFDGLLACVDFGDEANAFLKSVCGVRETPSPDQFAIALMDNYRKYEPALSSSVWLFYICCTLIVSM